MLVSEIRVDGILIEMIFLVRKVLRVIGGVGWLEFVRFWLRVDNFVEVRRLWFRIVDRILGEGIEEVKWIVGVVGDVVREVIVWEIVEWDEVWVLERKRKEVFEELVVVIGIGRVREGGIWVIDIVC